jgi:FkbM family methyltransferase
LPPNILVWRHGSAAGDPESDVLFNPSNWLALYRSLYVFANPLKFFVAVIRGEAPATVVVRSPTDRLTISLRNFESLRTLFSIFCRLDYRTDRHEAGTFLDVGANIGLASVYFLSRNAGNKVVAYEPDCGNLDFLKRNLAGFGSRARIMDCGIAVDAGETTLYRSPDGKYSSLIQSDRALIPQKIVTRAFSDVLDEVSSNGAAIIVKLDVEGMETALVRSISFESYPGVKRLICESTECADLISRPHRRILRSRYVEDLRFGDSFCGSGAS